jgi:hypothetical protein
MNLIDKFKNVGWTPFLGISTIIFVSIMSYKIYNTVLSIDIDFPTLLSIILALFSVALSALFYFKATETSNTFYDNTYKYTKDIAELLVKIESGFGERLKHLDEGYSSMQSYFKTPQVGTSSDELEKTKEKLTEEKEELKERVAERTKIIEDLIERSQLGQEEKTRITQRLSEKENEVLQLQKEVEKIKRRVVFEKTAARDSNDKDNSLRSRIGFGLERYTANVINKYDMKDEIIKGFRATRDFFSSIAKKLPDGYLLDLKNKGYFDGQLTISGYKFLREILIDID